MKSFFFFYFVRNYAPNSRIRKTKEKEEEEENIVMHEPY